jgi:hypothetical protein
MVILAQKFYVTLETLISIMNNQYLFFKNNFT